MVARDIARSLSEDTAKRLWAKIDKRTPEACWEWKGTKNLGYGRLSVGGRPIKATHLVLIFDGRPRENNLYALHSCDNRACCNPAHLSWGTHQQNMAERDERNKYDRNPRRGEGKSQAKLTAAKVKLIRRSALQGTQLAKLLGVHTATISDVRRGVTWRHVR